MVDFWMKNNLLNPIGVLFVLPSIVENKQSGWQKYNVNRIRILSLRIWSGLTVANFFKKMERRSHLA